MTRILRKQLYRAILISMTLTLTACAKQAKPYIMAGSLSTQQNSEYIYDPYEKANRKVHKFNVAFDKAILRPISKAYEKQVHAALREAVSNELNHLALTTDFAIQLVNMDFSNAGKTAVRFAINTVFGLGIADVAADFGFVRKKENFAAVLKQWNVPEGAYIELPLYGPSTMRNAIGGLFHVITSPAIIFHAHPASTDIAVFNLTARAIESRIEDGDFIDSVVNSVGDSYSVSKSVYIQNSRHLLSDGVSDEAPDIFSEPVQ